jgi:hypothetical protein
MPNQKPTKAKQGRPKPQPQQGHSPSNSQVVRADAPALDNLEAPHTEQGNKPHAAQRADARESQQEATRPYRRIDKLNIALTLFFSFVIVVFTGVSTYYSSKQWEVMDRTIQIENRAYVSVHKGSLGKELKVGEPASAVVFLVHKGNNPGMKARVESSIKFVDAPIPEPMMPLTEGGGDDNETRPQQAAGYQKRLSCSS